MSGEEESKRILKRLEEQSEKLLTGAPGGDDTEDDRIEALGKRIARIIAYGLAAFLIYWYWTHYF